MAMIVRQTCPECGSTDIVATGRGSSMFMCKSCGYVGGTHDTPRLGRELGVTEDEFEDEEMPESLAAKKERMPSVKPKTLKKKGVRKR